MDETTDVVKLSHVCKSFGGVHAVLDVTTNIRHGARHLFIGTNGAGKTTLFNLITGDLPMTSGKIEIFGQDVSKMNVQKRVRLGVRRTYQTSALMTGLTVRQNLYLALLGTESNLKHLNMFNAASRNKEYNAKIEKIAQEMKLYEKLNEEAINLSHGDCRQLELGMALIAQPKLLLLDEPAAGLSAEERQILVKVIQELPEDITVVLVEHDMQMAFAVATYVTVMYDGKIVAEGSVDEIQNNTLVQEIYLGRKVDVNAS